MAANLGLLLGQLNSLNPNPKKVGPYTNKQMLITVGDGNLSFSVSVATALGSGRRLIATTYDSRDHLQEKHGEEAWDNAEILRGLGTRVYHQVDATHLHEAQWLHELSQEANSDIRLFDRVIFNFPHVGGSQPEDVAANQELLKDFFESASKILKPAENENGGEIHVTLRRTPFYDSWKIADLARFAGLVLIKEMPFEADKFIGYVPKRTSPAVREAPSVEGAVTFAFKVGAAQRWKRAAKKKLAKKKKMSKEKPMEQGNQYYDENEEKIEEKPHKKKNKGKTEAEEETKRKGEGANLEVKKNAKLIRPEVQQRDSENTKIKNQKRKNREDGGELREEAISGRNPKENKHLGRICLENQNLMAMEIGGN